MRMLSILAALLLPGLAAAQLTCSSDLEDPSCANLTVTFAPNGAAGNYRIEMLGTGLHPNAFSALYWGDNSQNVALPRGCALLITPIWGTFHTTNSAGELSWGKSWPHWATIMFYMQMGSIGIDNGETTIRSTNSVYAGCM